MSKIKLIEIDNVLHSTLTIICKEDSLSYSEAIESLFLDGHKHVQIRNWISSLYDFSYTSDRGKVIKHGFKLIPVNEECWKAVTDFCRNHHTETHIAMRAMATKSTTGEFVRQIIKHHYNRNAKEDAEENEMAQSIIQAALVGCII